MIRVSEKQPELFKAQVKRQVPVEKESVGMIYQNANGSLYQGNSFEWLKTIESESIDLIFADPPDNINKTDWDKFESQEKYIEWSMQWIEFDRTNEKRRNSIRDLKRPCRIGDV